MQGRISGFIMTVVMALPLAAIPLMAIFGIPQFGSLASTMDADTGFLPEDPGAAAMWDSAPAFSENQPAMQTEAETRPGIIPVSNRLNSEHTQHATQGHVSHAEVTWEQAIEKLARYGIHDYRLQPGVESNTFHFACYLHGNSNRNNSTSTVVRFEAEASNPLTAVQKTLQQIEQWYR